MLYSANIRFSNHFKTHINENVFTNEIRDVLYKFAQVYHNNMIEKNTVKVQPNNNLLNYTLCKQLSNLYQNIEVP